MNDDAPRIRLRIIGVISLSLFAALVARLWYLQVLQTEVAEQRATANIERTVREPAPRGRILDVKGRVLVQNRVVNVVKVQKAAWDRRFPKSSKPQERLAAMTKLATEISRAGPLTKVADLERILDNAASIEEVTLASDVSSDLLLYIGERPDQFPGVVIGQALARDYPYGSLAAHVLGYVGRINDTEFESLKDSDKAYAATDDIGKDGIEKLFEDELRGTPGTRVYEVDNSERIIREVISGRTDPQPGNDVWLTIDIEVQQLAEYELAVALAQAREENDKRDDTDPDITAPAGSAVVLDPSNGSVLAMASYPTYDPADFVAGISQAKFDALRDPDNYQPILNRAIQGEYAPGSTFKLLTAYAAIDGGFMGTASLPGIEVRIQDPGTFHLGELGPCTEGCEFTNSRNAAGLPSVNNDVDMRRSISVSSDTYYYRIGAEIWLSDDQRAIQDTAEQFGLGRITGVQLPSERAGVVSDAELKQSRHEENPESFPFGVWTTGDNVNISVGQGDMLVTPLQLANVYATFANGGHLYAPNIASSIKEPDGEVVRPFGPREVDRFTLNAQARDVIMDGLLGAVSFNDPVGGRGTAYAAFQDFDLGQWPIAGKTGTAEVNGKADTALFAAFGPADPNSTGVVPRYTMVVVLEQSGFGGANAAPVVADVFDKMLKDEVPKAYPKRVLAACAARAEAEGVAPDATGADGGATDESDAATPTTTAPTAPTTAPTTAPSAVAAVGTSLGTPQLRIGEECPP